MQVGLACSGRRSFCRGQWGRDSEASPLQSLLEGDEAGSAPCAAQESPLDGARFIRR